MRSILTTLLCGALLITVPSSRQARFASSSRILAATPERIVVLTFDDAVKSHRTLVAPLLKQLGFGATFFVTHRWMDDSEHFLTWKEIAEIYEMGFEIGNHSWTHANFSVPKNAASLATELTLVEKELHKLGVPRPVSFAYSGNAFGPEAVEQLTRIGYRFARRGTQPEADYRNLELGPLFDPRKHHRLLIPTTGNAQPNWTPEHFQRIVNQAQDGQIVVLQFHGVPDVKHPWVHTPPELFRQYMHYLKQQGFRVIALRDLQKFLPDSPVPTDPMTETRYPAEKNQSLALPSEMVNRRGDLAIGWRTCCMTTGIAGEETAEAIGYPADEVKSLRQVSPKIRLPCLIYQSHSQRRPSISTSG